MDQSGVDAGLVHFLQQFLGREFFNLAVRPGRRHYRLRPDVNLRVDDLHGGTP
jgi:hypothetical protein